MVARFDGLGRAGEEDAVEVAQLAACYKAPLNAQVRGGRLEWTGTGQWQPHSVCVDCKSPKCQCIDLLGFEY